MEDASREPVVLNHQMDGSEPPSSSEILGALTTNLRLLASEMEEGQNAPAEEEQASEQSRVKSLLQQAMELNSITQIDHYLHQATSSLAGECKRQESEEVDEGSTEAHAQAEEVTESASEAHNAGMKTTGEDDSDANDINLSDDNATLPPSDGKESFALSEKLPSFTADDEQREQAALSDSERMTVSADLRGHQPSMEKALLDFACELERIPVEEKTSLEKALQEFPLLTHTSSHVMLFLRSEKWDPKRAARRAVQYWEKRERLLGDQAFKFGACSSPTDEDFLRLYAKTMGQALDPGSDLYTRKIAMSCFWHWEQEKISGLVRELEMIPAQQKTALAGALKEYPELAASDEHMLLFLRSMDFDERKAAHRMVHYWKERLEIFGHDEAFRPITVQSLMEDHAAELTYGFNRVLPGTDAFGRVLFYGKGFDEGPPENFTYDGILKSTWYVFESLAEKVECQMNGLVIVGNGMTLNQTDTALIMKLRRIAQCMPLKIKALHDCKTHVPWWSEVVMPFVKWALGKTIRLRFVQHMGTNDDILAGLQEHGISRDQVSVDFGGDYSDDSWKDWLNQQQKAGR